MSQMKTPKYDIGQDVRCIYIEGDPYEIGAQQYRIKTITVNSDGIMYSVMGEMGLEITDIKETDLAAVYDGKGVNPGDTIICENGKHYTCVSREDYTYSNTYPSKEIYAEKRGINGSLQEHMYWDNIQGKSEYDSTFSIAYIIPKDTDMTENKQEEQPQKEPEQTYTFDEFVLALNALMYLSQEKSDLLKEKLRLRRDPEYKEYLRLKQKFDGVS